MKKIILNIPANIKIILWEKKFNNYVNINLFNENKNIILVSNKNKIFIDKWSNSIVLINKETQFYFTKINNILYKFFKSFNSFFFNKIKFKGKGFRIKFYKKIKLVKFFFGKSHKTFYLFKNIKIKKINKYKFIILSLNKKKVNDISNNITKIKNINVYTLRGLRLSRQIINKRKGKKGTYI